MLASKGCLAHTDPVFQFTKSGEIVSLDFFCKSVLTSILRDKAAYTKWMTTPDATIFFFNCWD